ncbi:hypothetical protein P879_03305 [Paragonimus westermani]|uniref:Zinc metalloproteinase n=1 Tax=Paragonimus westermani TaxID=34504 RepID=A0A8T0DH19_9TREM|nr:hypothetical protein P879_03305 [Paragonimus westermani]
MFQLWNAHDLLHVCYPLFQLKGKLDPFCGCVQIVVSVDRLSTSTCWNLCHSLFKAFVTLFPGCNLVRISCQHFWVELRLVYEFLHKPERVVQPIYVVCCDESGTFQTATDSPSCNLESALRRIGFGIRLLQTLTAESLYSEYGKRCTFLCTEDPNYESVAQVPCRLHRSNFTQLEVYTAAPKVIWSKLARELRSTYPDQFEATIWIAFMACTRYEAPLSENRELMYEEMQRMAKANFALGAGGLALLGTATLHAWPEDLDSLTRALSDTRRLQHMGVMDDTAYRHTFWAAFATGLGSVWHELGHCFGLDHSPIGIMNRGGDDVHLCLGFPPLGSCCGSGCEHSERPSVSASLSLNPPTPLPTAIQFQRYTLLYQPLSNTVKQLSTRVNFWAPCHSLWHQGSAFWGSTHVAKLLRSPWIVVAER